MTDEVVQLQTAIDALELQRATLGDLVVDSAIASLRQKLSELQSADKVEQRKHVTILFADLVGFTPLSEKNDPEDLQALLQQYFSRWTDCIRRYGGAVEKLIGDAILATFGLAEASEDDPQNAIRAALEMQSELQTCNAAWEVRYGARLTMRTGIHTGLVVVSRLQAGQDAAYEIMGDAVNLASRLQTAAPPGGILISHDTYTRVKGIFDLQPLGAMALKGKSEPVDVYQVQRLKPRAFQVDPRGVEGVETPLVGRTHELQMLQDAYAATAAGSASWITITGEAGVGKTRLLSEIHDWLDLRPETILIFKARGAAPARSHPYALLRDLIAFRFNILENDSREQVQARLESGAALFFKQDVEMKAHFIGAWLGFDLSGSPHLAAMRADPRQLYDRALAYLVELFTAAALTAPAVLFIEDIHWADEQSLEALIHLFRQSAALRLLILCATRPSLFERFPDWNSRIPEQRLLALHPLSEDEAQQLAQTILARLERMPPRLVDLIVTRAEGNPFYLEELIKMFIEAGLIDASGDQWQVDLGRAESLQVPPLLTDILQARIDRLPDAAKSCLQRASVVGRIFWEQAVARLYDTPEASAAADSQPAAALALLQAREMIFRRDQPAFEGDHEYAFKHALLRDVAYENILKRRRKEYHARVAAWLAETAESNGRAAEFAALIAGHYAGAADAGRAAHWYALAGAQAAAQYANRDAVHLFNLALEHTSPGDLHGRVALLLQRQEINVTLGDPQEQAADLDALEAALRSAEDQAEPDRTWIEATRTELDLRRAAFNIKIADYRAALEHARRAAERARAIGSLKAESFAKNLWGASLYRQSEYLAAAEILTEALHLARLAQDDFLQADSLRLIGIIHDRTGDSRQAIADFEEALQGYRRISMLRGEAMCLNSLGVMALEMNDLDAAGRYCEEALRINRLIGNRYGEGVNLSNLAQILDTAGRLEAAQSIYRQTLDVCRELEDAEGEAVARAGLGWAAYRLGDAPAAAEYFRQAIEIAARIGDREGEYGYLEGLSRVHLSGGDSVKAEQAARQAVDIARQINAPVSLARALTQLGNCLAALGRTGDAMDAYRQSLDLASTPDAHSVENWIGLAWIHFESGRLEEARTAIEPAAGWLESDRAAEISSPGEHYWRSYQVLAALDGGRAGRLLETAVGRIRAQAAGISDPAARRSFLENVSANRRLLAAHAQQTQPPA